MSQKEFPISNVSGEIGGGLRLIGALAREKAPSQGTRGSLDLVRRRISGVGFKQFRTERMHCRRIGSVHMEATRLMRLSLALSNKCELMGWLDIR